jgi:transcriptional regulator with GAF, ATPase, and Fis domain
MRMGPASVDAMLSRLDSGLADLLACVAAFGRSLHETFDPQKFLGEFSSRVQPLVPHDRILILYAGEQAGTFTVFAEDPGVGAPLHEGRYTTDFDPGGRYSTEEWGLGPVCEGEVLHIKDVEHDPRMAERPAHRARLLQIGIHARIVVPLYAGGRAIGALGVANFTADAYTSDHVGACRQIADLIGPFVENVVLLHRERRRRRRLQAVTALAPILGGSLKVGDLIERLGEAVRPVLDFDAMSVKVVSENGRDLELVGAFDVDRDVSPTPVIVSTEDCSLPDRVTKDNVVLIRHAEHELDARRAGDRAIIERGVRSLLIAPLVFADRVDGVLSLAKRRPNWYDDADAEVARALASEVIVAIQHQRLAEERQRLRAMEVKARRLEERVESLRGELADRYGFDRIIGRAPVFLESLQQAKKVAATETTVLLTGESGTGKEVLAHAIHHASARADGPFVAVNCAALPETLIESELFGHERGAFTGADKLKRGRFELAAGGTLFLDEIGELAPAIQAKLLRVLQERQYERVGGTVTLAADVRLVAATNRDLERAVADGRFREDLYYRLAVFRVHLPALRERGDDVLLLAGHLARELGAKLGKGDPGLSRDARALLLGHRWPGNIRELQNAIERALIVSDNGLLTPEQFGITLAHDDRVDAAASASASGMMPEAVSSMAPMESLADLEKRSITEALARASGNKSRAAASLGLSRTQLYTRLKRFGLDR